MTVTLLQGDCRDVLPTLAENSIDSVVSDTPYELGFMGSAWDKTGVAFEVPMWRQVLRVAKPGAWLLAFGGTRTWHRLACAVEDAGWEIRDCMMWLYGQGFPKSHNGEWGGTALKPGWEPIVMARKPFKGTVAQCFEKWGTGALNIDGARIAGAPRTPGVHDAESITKEASHVYGDTLNRTAGRRQAAYTANPPAGRWPANVLLSHVDGPDGCELVGRKRVKATAPPGPNSKGGAWSGGADAMAEGYAKAKGTMGVDGMEDVEDWRCVDGCPVRLLDEQSGELSTHGGKVKSHHAALGFGGGNGSEREVVASKGGASRFFYTGKATKKDRGEGNDHPTVKPSKLIEYLLPLITPAGGTVLDHFMGSGTVGKVARSLGYGFVGIELDAHNLAIATGRIQGVDPLFARTA